MGDEKLQNIYTMWKVIITGMVTQLADSILCDIVMDRIRPCKKLQTGLIEFDKMREDDPRNNIRWLVESIDRLMQRDRLFMLERCKQI